VDERQLARLASRRHGVFSKAQALVLGATQDIVEHRLKTGRWLRVAPNVYRIAGVPETWHGRVLAEVLSAGPCAVVSHRTAAVLSGLEGARVRRPGIRVHESLDLPDPTATVRDAIPVTGIARTLLDIGAVVPFERVDQAIDDGLRRHLTDWPTLWETLITYARRGRRGAGPLRAVLDERFGERVVPDSWMERCFLRVLADTGLPLPEPQYELRDGADRFVGRLDFAYVTERVAIELDSVAHHDGRRALTEDDRRQNRITLLGWLVLRFTWRDLVERPDRVCADVAAALQVRVG
jgi:hypothetical protein